MQQLANIDTDSSLTNMRGGILEQRHLRVVGHRSEEGITACSRIQEAPVGIQYSERMRIQYSEA